MQNGEAIISNEISKKIIWETSKTAVSYPEALTRMSDIQTKLQKGNAPETIWLLEHPPLFTSGTSARPEDLFNPKRLPVFEAGRGGQWTYHGPGQRIVYLMLDLNRRHGQSPPRDLRHFVSDLEQWVILTLRQFGIEAATRAGRIGVWTTDPISGREAKIAAIGLRVSRWTTSHGISINVSPNLEDFEGIVPCGIREFGVTSIRRFQKDVSMTELDEALRTAWQTIFETTDPPV